jgi:hypothetical protein
MIRAAVALALLLLGSSCAFGIAIDRSGFAARWEWFDVRVGTKDAKAGSASTSAEKRPMSDNLLEFGEVVGPLLAEAAARGAAEGVLGASGAGLVCKIPELLEGAGEKPVQVDPDRVELSPEKIRELKDRRRERMALWEAARAEETAEEAASRADLEAAWAEAIEGEERRIRELVEEDQE